MSNYGNRLRNRPELLFLWSEADCEGEALLPKTNTRLITQAFPVELHRLVGGSLRRPLLSH